MFRMCLLFSLDAEEFQWTSPGPFPSVQGSTPFAMASIGPSAVALGSSRSLAWANALRVRGI